VIIEAKIILQDTELYVTANKLTGRYICTKHREGHCNFETFDFSEESELIEWIIAPINVSDWMIQLH
jgi:hypothetical protein